MTGHSVIGYRADGRVIHLLFGAADDDTEPQGVGDTGGNGPAPKPAPAAQHDDTDLRAELDRLRQENATHQERLRALMAGGGDTTPAAASTDEDDDEDDSKGSKTDPELAKLRKAIRAANAEAKARREREDKLRREWDEQDRQHKAQLDEARRLSEAAEKARLEAEARYKPATIRAAAVPALLTAGAKPDRADRLVRLLDMNALDVDANGEVTGLAEQVAAVKQEWPELFRSDEEPKPRVPRVTVADRPPVEEQPRRSADVLAAQVLGRTA